ncbi:MAG TPA: alpha/beta hydrolase [Solirubrobacterales bacterium]|jgi:pimeloyl-ACP methyl ester carboxylesterase|nr:alpha/beta hydrolase [Solirubrobacterales bacterium]
MGDFLYEGHRIEYSSYGEDERVLVLVHGLLMNRRMYEKLGPALARRGNRVICVDLLGHGQSDRPEDLRLYSMPLFARQVVALLDHLELPSAIVGGTSLGANVALELATRDPERVRGLFIEMPVLDNALPAVAGAFTPVLLGLRVGRPAFELVSRLTSLVPRTNYLVDIGLDWVRQRPGPSGAVLEGLLLGETAPHREQRRQIKQRALIVGHARDPVHPFSDSGMLAEELENARLVVANSILEWRFSPKRLNAELASFLAEVWAGAIDEAAAPGTPAY